MAIHAGKKVGHQSGNAIKSIYGPDDPDWIGKQLAVGNKPEIFEEEKASAFLKSYGYWAAEQDGTCMSKNLHEPWKKSSLNLGTEKKLPSMTSLC